MQSLIRTKPRSQRPFSPSGSPPASPRISRRPNAFGRKTFGSRDRTAGGRIRLVFKTFVLAVVGTFALTLGMAIWGIMHTPVAHPAQPLTVNDVTQLNPIPVAEVIAPTTIDEIVAAVRSHAGPVSIGGGRVSLGGPNPTPGAVPIDLQGFTPDPAVRSPP